MEAGGWKLEAGSWKLEAIKYITLNSQNNKITSSSPYKGEDDFAALLQNQEWLRGCWNTHAKKHSRLTNSQTHKLINSKTTSSSPYKGEDDFAALLQNQEWLRGCWNTL